jgi:hypothetical protein
MNWPPSRKFSIGISVFDRFGVRIFFVNMLQLCNAKTAQNRPIPLAVCPPLGINFGRRRVTADWESCLSAEPQEFGLRYVFAVTAVFGVTVSDFDLVRGG